MGGVFCPVCEADVDATAKFCLSCGHQFAQQGPITATGHDLRQLKEVIKEKDDLSMAEKFDLIAQIEDGANPIRLGIAAPADGDETYDGLPHLENINLDDSSKSQKTFGDSIASNAAVKAVMSTTDAWTLVNDGKINFTDELYQVSMNLGIDASKHIHDVASGEHEGVDPEMIKEIPVLKPPKRSFCPKCGSEIQAYAMMQWRKWRDLSSEVVSMQLEAAMETSLIQVSSHYLNQVENLEMERDRLAKKVAALEKEIEDNDIQKIRAKVRKEIEPKLRAQLKEEMQSMQKKDASTKQSDKKESKIDQVDKKETSPVEDKKSATAGKVTFGAKKKSSKKFEGDSSEKADWFLKEALDTVYDPHGTGKKLTKRTILARSSEGNVRVEDVVRSYADGGKDSLSDLAWTSPITQYLIEAYDSC